MSKNTTGKWTIHLFIAVTPEQVEQYNLPTTPPKKTDNRKFDGLTTQCEALDPITLAGIVRHAIESQQDANIRQAVINNGSIERDKIAERFRLAN